MSKSWDDFSRRMLDEASQSKGGRDALRRRWEKTRQLAAILAERIDEAEVRDLLGKPFAQLDPEENDIKAFIAYAIGRGVLPKKSALREALTADYLADPLAFLACISGKAFGETWGPKIVDFWLTNADDRIKKMKSKDFYDVAWHPHELADVLVRIEIKSSSEYPAFRFQQVRHPRLSNSEQPDYDILLCLGLTAGALEWWCIPSWDLDSLADNGENEAPIITRHHGKKRSIWNPEHGYRDEGWFVTGAKERKLLQEYSVTSEELRARVLQVAQSRP